MTKVVRLKDIPEVNFNETYYLPLFQIVDTRNKDKYLKYDDDLKRFVSIKITQSFENFYTSEFKKEDIGLRECEITDFRTEYQKGLFNILSAG